MGTWHSEYCPACGAVNWWPQLNDEDVTAIECHDCKAKVLLFSGEWGEEYNPHVEGTEATDSHENRLEFWWDGDPKPT